ncbi:MAG TPA: hypothetical protein PKW15_07315 [Alphaproteobacteria bacterium]|nr:hypothetical protein [Alphaproteobacteria bacterium]
MAYHETQSEEYNPARDYTRVMNWFKWGAVVCIVLTVLLTLLIG